MDKEIKEQVKTIGYLLLFCIVMFYGLHLMGGLRWICDKFADVGLRVAGYEEQIYVVKMEEVSAVPIYRDNYVEQEIYLTTDVADANSLMLEITIGVYGRTNTGPLYVQISQGDINEVYSIDLAELSYDKRLNLISHNSDWEEGSMCVKLYAPYSTEENFIGIYVEQSLEVYSELVVNGEKTPQNACINLSIPSKEAQEDFVQVENVAFRGYVQTAVIPLLAGDAQAFDIYIPQSDAKKYVVELLFFTYDRVNEGDVCVDFVQGESKESFVIDTKNLMNGESISFILDSKIFSGGLCEVQIYSLDAGAENCVGVGIMRIGVNEVNETRYLIYGVKGKY